MLLAFQLAGQSAIKHPRGQQVLTLLKAVWCESDAAVWCESDAAQRKGITGVLHPNLSFGLQ